MRATVLLLQQEPGKDGRAIYRPRWPPREAWSALLACQITILAAVFGWMVTFAPEQLRVDAERRRTDCVRLPGPHGHFLPPLRGACLPIVENGLLPTQPQPLRLRGGFAPHLRRRTALTAAALSLVGRRPAKATPSVGTEAAAVSSAAGPSSNGAPPPAGAATPPLAPPLAPPFAPPAAPPAALPATRTSAQLERGPNTAGPNSNGAMEERYTIGSA